METVISPDKISGHVIQKYQFKVLAVENGATSLVSQGQECGEVQNYRFETMDAPQNETKIDEGVEEQKEENEVLESSRDDFVEQLLKKADELSDKLIKMQMQMEKQQSVFDARLEEERKQAYDEGVEAGKIACQEESEAQIAALRERFAQAVVKLEESREQLMKKIDTIEEELIETALDLARQVVVKEVERDSQEVAYRLAKLLLTEVKEASSITLKVNPKDYDYLKEHLAPSANLEIVSDEAVSEGGVVILSDVGNIDGEIMARFERIKEAVFGPSKQGSG